MAPIKIPFGDVPVRGTSPFFFPDINILLKIKTI
jgi:hypothetical protein